MSRRARREVDRRALANIPLGPRLAAVAEDDLLHGGEPDAAPLELALRVEPLERPEHPRGVGRVEARAVVAHVVRRRAAVLLHPELDRGVVPPAGELPGV